MPVHYALASHWRMKLYHGWPPIQKFTANTQEYHFVMRMENGKCMTLNPNTTLKEGCRFLIIKLLLFLMKHVQEEQI